MQTITLKYIPDDVHTSLKKLAKLHHRSLNGEILHYLERYTRFCKNDVSQVLERARRNRENIGSYFSATDIQAAINEGRL